MLIMSCFNLKVVCNYWSVSVGTYPNRLRRNRECFKKIESTYNLTRNTNIPYVILIKQLFLLYSRENFSVMYRFELPRSCVYVYFIYKYMSWLDKIKYLFTTLKQIHFEYCTQTFCKHQFNFNHRLNNQQSHFQF